LLISNTHNSWGRLRVEILKGESFKKESFLVLEEDGSLVDSDGVNVELGEVDSSDGNNLSDNVISIDEDSLLVDDVDDDTNFALVLTVIDVDDSADLNELVEHHFCWS